MKILLVNTFYYPQEYGGAERMVKRLADELLRIGHEPEVVCLSPTADEGSADVDGVRVHRVRLRNVYPLFPRDKRSTFLKPIWHAVDSFNVVMARKLDGVVARVRPDIVHTHNLTGFSPHVWSVLSRRAVPIVHTLHDYYLLCARSTMFLRGRNCTARHLPCAALSIPRLRGSSAVATVVGVSRFVLDRHLGYGAFANARARHVIGNPSFRVSRGNAAPATPRDQALRLGFLGRLESAKGIDVLLEAVNALKPGGWSLDVAGMGEDPYVRDLQSRFARPAVRFVGKVDAAEFLPSLDVLVVPSRSHETFGMVIAEAHSVGIPVIASRIGGMSEIVEEGRTGFLVRAGETSDLSELLERLIAQPETVRSMRPACLIAAEQFAPEHVARQYVEVYRPLLSQR